MESRDGASGTAGDGVVIISDAVQLPHQLDAMLHAAEGLRHGPDVLRGGVALYRADGGHIIFHVVDAGQQNIPARQNGRAVEIDCVALQPDAARRLGRPGEELHRAGRTIRKATGDVIVVVQHQFVALVLEAENLLLGMDVFVHILVDVQVVGGQIGHHGHSGGMGHIHQLEGAEFHYRQIVRLHLPCQRQQRLADVAADPDGLPAFLRISAISVVVVVFPSEPVTAKISQGQTWKNDSISEVITLPCSRSLEPEPDFPGAFQGCGRRRRRRGLPDSPAPRGERRLPAPAPAPPHPTPPGAFCRKR